jgi:hypothetical protein
VIVIIFKINKMEQKTYAVPEGCKITSVDFQSGVIVYECETPEAPKFKRGDFVYCEHDRTGNEAIFLLDEYIGNGECKTIAGIGYKGIFKLGYVFSLHSPRLATPEEKQLLLDKMHEQGKDWAGGQIVDWEWKPKVGEPYWALSFKGVYEVRFEGDYADNERLKENRAFATEALAQQAFTDLQTCLKNAKKY